MKLGAEALFLALALIGVANGGMQLRLSEIDPAAVADDISTTQDVSSPFAPWAGIEREPKTVDALLGSIRAAGVRIADDPMRSGAVLTLYDHEQRLFGIGEEVAFGARLAAVHIDHVLLEREGRLTRVALADWSPQQRNF